MSKEKSAVFISPTRRPSNPLFHLQFQSSTPISTRSCSTGGLDERLTFWSNSLAWSPTSGGSLPGTLPCSAEECTRLSSPPAANVTTSSGPICRICHEGDQKWPLLSPCTCSGTMGLVHLVCLEHWLSASGGDQCEICHYRFSTERRERGFCEWLQESHRSVRRSFLGDLLCFAMLTPLAFLCGILCLQGAAHQIISSRLWEAIGLTTLAVLLFLVYTGWSVLTLRYHRKTWKKWQKANPHVKVLGVSDMPVISVPEPLLRDDVERSAAAPVASTLARLGALGGNTVHTNAVVHHERVSLQSPVLCFSPTTLTLDSTQWEYCTSRL
ncbi:unnamed protein product [Ixodes hexagonus]